jgi:hypothetical protein
MERYACKKQAVSSISQMSPIIGQSGSGQQQMPTLDGEKYGANSIDLQMAGMFFSTDLLERALTVKVNC